MFKRARFLIATLLFGALPTAMAGISSFPGLGDPTFSEADLLAAFNRGKATGRVEVSAECIADPAECGCADGLNPCGVTSSSTLTGAQFGETEPNNHIVAADPLVTEVIYWGQSRSIIDEDWFYITTVEPNQLLTLVFTVPDRVLNDTSRLSQGWLVQVRDAGGNIYAEFDTRFQLDDLSTLTKNESKEITYPIFLGHTGTYYVVVQPQLADSTGTPITNPVPAGTNLNDLSILYSPYNIAAFLQFSGLDAVPPDVNFYDVEIEPNNNLATANALSTGVSIFGLLRQTGDGGSITVDPTTGGISFSQTDVDYFKYYSQGNEQVQFAWCGREACTEDVFWFVEVMKPDGTTIISFNTDKAETVHFGLADRGWYYIQVNFQRKTDARCLEYSDTELECLVEGVACFKDTNNQYDDAACTSARNTQGVLVGTNSWFPQNPVPAACTNTGIEAADVTLDFCNSGDPRVPLCCTQATVDCDTFPELCTVGGDFDGEARTSVWTEQADNTFCSSLIMAPAEGCTQDGEFPDITPANILSGQPLFRNYQFQTTCTQFDRKCLEYGPVNELDASNNPVGLNVEYNFTWWGTGLLPLTNGTPGFDVFQERPSFYNGR